MLDDDVRMTLVMAIDAVSQNARDPWWIIASAAVALHGGAPIDVGDVDLLLSVGDADVLLRRLGIAPSIDAGSAKFRSAIFARWTEPPLTVEILADFHVATAEGWTPVRPLTRVPIEVDRRVIYVPGRHELAAMLRLFGRPKDLARAELLSA